MQIIILFCLALIMGCSDSNVISSAATTTPTVVGLLRNDSSGSYSFVRMNSETGEILLAVTHPGISGFRLADVAIDTSGGRYFIQGDSNGTTRLLTFNTSTGAIIASPNLPEVIEMEYEPATNKLLGIRIVNGTSQLVRVDPATGTITTVASMPGLDGIQFGSSSFAPNTSSYFLVVGDSLVTVNTASGTVVASPSIAGTHLSNARYEPANGMVVALTYRTRTEEVIRIDPSSGAVSTVGTIPEVQWIYQGEADISVTAGRLLFLGKDSTDIRRLYSVNLSTGAVAARPTVGTLALIQVLP